MTANEWRATLATICARTPLSALECAYVFQQCAEFYEYARFSLYASLDQTDLTTIHAQIVHDYAEHRDRSFSSTDPEEIIAWLNRQHRAALGDPILEAIMP